MVKKVTSIMLTVMLIINTMAFPSQQTVKAEETRPIVKVGDKYYYADIVADDPTSTAPVYSGSADVDSDEYKAANAKGMFKTPGGDGRVWTDKSVAVAADNKSFDVTLSTVGQAYYKITEVTTRTRADVLFILDDTSSMWRGNDITVQDSGNVRRYVAMVQAANQCIDIIMNANPDNRVEVVVYKDANNNKSWSEDDRILLPLGSYKKGSSGKYIDYTTLYEPDTDSINGYKLDTADGLQIKSGSGYTDATAKSIENVTGTYTQYNTYKGIQDLISKVDNKTTDIKTIPYVFVLTDGNSNASNSGTTANDYIYPDNQDDFTGRPNDTQRRKITASTILTTAYWKDQLSNEYYEFNKKAYPASDVKTRFFTVALSKDVTDEYVASIAPKTLLDSYSGTDGSWNSNSDFRTLKNETLKISKDNANAVRNNLNTYAETSTALNKYKITSDSDANSASIFTTDTYYYQTTSYEGLNQAFIDLANNVKQETEAETITPIREDITGEVFGGVMLKDVLGEGMKINSTTFVATANNVDYTFIESGISADEQAEGVIKKYSCYDSAKDATMLLLIYEDATSKQQTLVWAIPGTLLPLFVPQLNDALERTGYTNAYPIQLEYNVSLSDDKITAINQSASSTTVYSNYFSGKELIDKSKDGGKVVIGDALGIYVPNNDNPHFNEVNEQGEPVGRIHSRFVYDFDDATAPYKTILANKNGDNTSTATAPTAPYAGVAEYPVVKTDDQGDINTMYNYLGNNGKLTLTPVAEKEIDVEKEWVTSENKNNLTFTANLYATVTVGDTTKTTFYIGSDGNLNTEKTKYSSKTSAAGVTALSWTNLPPLYEYTSGSATEFAPVTYFIDETSIDHYSTAYISESADETTSYTDGNIVFENNVGSITITNTEVIDIPVKKTWEDNTDSYGNRPTSIVVDLKADGSKVKDIELNSNNGWEGAFENLPVVNKDTGLEIAYTVSETKVPGYYEPAYLGNKIEGFIVNNTLETLKVIGTKTWDDSAFLDKTDIGYSRPEITINIYGKIDGEEKPLLVDSIKVTSGTVDKDNENVWNWESKVLPAYRSGKPVKYTVEEVVPDGYTSKVTDYSVVNIPGKEEYLNPLALVVNKFIFGGGKLNGVVFTLTNPDGTTIDYKTENDGTATIGFKKPGTYTLKETSAPDGFDMDPKTYSIVVDQSEIKSVKVKEDKTVWQWVYDLFFTEDTKSVLSEDNTLDIYDTEYINIPVKKVWDDENNRDKVRPESVTVNLYADGVLLKNVNINDELVEDGSMVLSKENEWVSVFTKLDKYDKDTGKLIKYEVKEVVPAKYAVSYSGDLVSGVVIKNIHKPTVPPTPYIPPQTSVE